MCKLIISVLCAHLASIVAVVMCNCYVLAEGNAVGDLSMHYRDPANVIILHLIIVCIFLGLSKRQDVSMYVKFKISKLLMLRTQSSTHVPLR